MSAEPTPLVTAMLACEIADVGFDPASFDGENDLPHGGFLLESELAPGLTLGIEHREADAAFIVRSDTEVKADRLSDAMRIAVSGFFKSWLTIATICSANSARRWAMA